jgi:hypothetical protein
MSRPNINPRRLNGLVSALVLSAGRNTRAANAVKNGARLIREGCCEFVGAEAVRVKSPSGKTYIASLTDCAQEHDGPQCEAFAQAVPCKHRAAARLMLAMRPQRLTLPGLLRKAAEGYPDLTAFFDAETGAAVEGEGGGLALFIVRELKDTFDPEATYAEQIEEARRVLARAADDLQGALVVFEQDASARLLAA